MKIVGLILCSVVVCLLASCSSQPTPTVVATLTPSPETESTSTIAPTVVSNVLLVAGQWNYLFYHPELKKVVLVNGGPDRGKSKNDPLELWAWDGT